MGENTGSRESVNEAVMQEDHPFPLTEVDKWVLSQTDEEFHMHDWEELKEIVGEWAVYPRFAFCSHFVQTLVPFV